MTIDRHDLNKMEGLVPFLRRWEQGSEATYARVRLLRSELGNLNLEGRADCQESVTLTRHHPSFEASLEAGVRDLVLAIVDGWNCVTYSSCEGHPSTAISPWRFRNIRILSRAMNEDRAIRARLEEVAVAVNSSSGVEVSVLIARSQVTAEGGMEAPGWDLVFAPQSVRGEEAYWGALEVAYCACLKAVESVAS